MGVDGYAGRGERGLSEQGRVARTHICIPCGLDLGRIAPTIEPLYGFPLVVCPRCGTPTVRRVAEVRATVRWWRRLVGACLYAGFHSFLVVAISLLVFGAIGGMTGSLHSYGLRIWKVLQGLLAGEYRDPSTDVYAWYNDRGQLWLVAMLCLSVLTGGMMQFVMPHWKRRAMIPLWVLGAHVMFLVPPTYDQVVRWLYEPTRGIVNAYQPQQMPGLSDWTWENSWHCIALLWVCVVLGVAGVPIGRIANRMAVRTRRTVLRIYKRRVRLARDQT